jgi:hypothetical protein
MSNGGQGISLPAVASTRPIVPVDARVSVPAGMSQPSQTEPSVASEPTNLPTQPPVVPEPSATRAGDDVRRRKLESTVDDFRSGRKRHIEAVSAILRELESEPLLSE